MDVHHDVIAQSCDPLHGYGQAVSGDGLGDVLDQLAAVGLSLSPLLGFLIDSHVDDVLAAVPRVHLQVGVPVAELPAAGQLDEQVAVDVAEGDAVLQSDGAVFFDDCPGRHLAVAPELHHAGVGPPPLVHDALELVLRDGAALVHALHGADAALVAAGQNCDLSFLAEVAVGSVLFHGHVVHHGGGLAIDVLALPESLQGPFLAGDPRQHAGLDGREVRDNEAAAF